jgi:hypothetical protein
LKSKKEQAKRSKEKTFCLKKEIFVLAIKFILLIKIIYSIAGVAQLVEHCLAMAGVAGSSPVTRSKKNNPTHKNKITETKRRNQFQKEINLKKM